MTSLVRQVIIEPMGELYLPPLHLRADREARSRALDAYETALAPFDRTTLQRAWEKVVAEQTFWVWPNPGVIVEACRQCQSRSKPPSDKNQPRAKALQMTEDYTRRYMRTSQVAKLATREGWDGKLREYVAGAAWVQAQLICQVQAIGWDTHLADDLGHFHSSQEAFTAYRKTIEKPVERGQIRVTVPRSRIREWKEQPQQHPTIAPPR
jgi:hypothetical protein